MKMYATLGIILTALITGSQQADPEVHLQQGVLKGTILQSVPGNKSYSAFMGIPYAKAPVGILRFKEPQPPGSWNGTREAFREGPSCPQINPITSTYEGEEDCLYLNVYTPKLSNETETQLKSVMVWIHGGGWYVGNGNRKNNGPDYLVEHGVVIVVMNYRLAALGFLSLPEVWAHGNNGLKDQVMALRWVKQNIAVFGGDPNNVTIFGASAGGASVHYHMLSPMSQGLFQRGIMQSGTALNYWSFNESEANRNYTFLLGQLLGHNMSDAQELYQRLLAETPERIVNFTNILKDRVQGIPFHPISDTTAAAGNVFISENPRTLIKEGRFHAVPFIVGINSREGIWDINSIRKAIATNSIHLKDIPKELSINLEEQKINEMTEEIRKLYFGNASVSTASLDQHIELSGDLGVVIGSYLTARKHAHYSTLPIYFYEFSYSGGMSVFKTIAGGYNLTGSCHLDDTAYLFRLELVNKTFESDSSEMRTSRRISKLWTDFAKYGNPTPSPDALLQNVTWSPVSQADVTYLNIGDDISLQHHFNKNKMEFWEALYQFNTTSS